MRPDLERDFSMAGAGTDVRNSRKLTFATGPISLALGGVRDKLRPL